MLGRVVGVVRVHRAHGRNSYGARRIHTELKIGIGMHVGKNHVTRLMRQGRISGVSHGCKIRSRPMPAVHDYPVRRQIRTTHPKQFWGTHVKVHSTTSGQLDNQSFSIPFHLRGEHGSCCVSTPVSGQGALDW